MSETRAISIERAGLSRLFLYAGLACAVVIGYAIAMNVSMAFGLLAAIALFCLVVLRPTALVPLLVVVSVLIESTLRSISVSTGGEELLNFNGVVNLALVGATLVYVAAGRIRPSRSRISRCFLLYCAFVVLSALFSVDVLLTVRSLIRIAAAYCIYLIITQFLTARRQLDRVFQLLMLVSAIPIAVGLYQIAFENHFVMSHYHRMAGTFATGTSFAMYLALILPYIFGQIFLSKTTTARKGWLCLLFLGGLIDLAYNPTRIAWAVFAFTMVSYAVLCNAKKFLPPLLAIMLLTVIVFLPFFQESFGGYFTTSWKQYFSNDTSWEAKSQDYIATSSLHIRVYVWRHMVRAVAENNLLTGMGSGTWFNSYDRKAMGFPLASHSDYFEVLFGTGLLGLSAYLLFRARQVGLLARFARRDPRIDVRRTILYPCLLTHIACLGMSLTEVWQSYSGVYWLSWITLAISEAYYNSRDSDRDNPLLAAEVDSREEEDPPAEALPPDVDCHMENRPC
ncbi:MAG: hypothetical protein A2Y77_03430 [Planctomycetes bacterium RBG_13_62_9]|nr:MAG: hypothetical protein A2Y77_03430 [Planctomycetes bacterium RBG_13_62_9]